MLRDPVEKLGEGGHCFELWPGLTNGLYLAGAPGAGKHYCQWPIWALLSGSFSLELGAQWSVPSTFPPLPNAEEQVRLVLDLRAVSRAPFAHQDTLLCFLVPGPWGSMNQSQGSEQGSRLDLCGSK